MRISLVRALALLLSTAPLSIHGVSAQDVKYASNYALVDDSQPAEPTAAAETAPASGPSCTGSCNSCGSANCGGCVSCDNACGRCGSLCAVCDECPKRGLVLFTGIDSWRGFSDGSFQNNTGTSTGLNYGTRLGRFSELTGIGFQAGGSLGVYDWSGRQSSRHDTNAAQTQGFLTYGLFRKANENSNWSAGLVNDWMFNDNFSVYAQNPTLSQWRGQISYAMSARNELGVWATRRGRGDTRTDFAGPVSYRAIDQMNLFWHHKFDQGADSWLWVGRPDPHRLSGPGSLGDFIIGGNVNIPVSERFAVYTNLAYMHPSAKPGPAAAREDAFSISVGIAFYPGWNARSRTVAGQCWMPLMPVANNGNFFVDSSSSF